MNLGFVLLDVFTDTPLSGNQLAVFDEPARALDGELMQRIAREMNLSETVFVERSREGGDARARIFTPSAELPFAGHPTLGTAIALGAAQRLPRIALELAVGIVPVELDWSGKVPTGRMIQPLPSYRGCAFAAQVLTALGIDRARIVPEIYSNGPSFVIVLLTGRDELATLSPDGAALRAFGDYGFYCAAEIGPASFEVRMFSPAFGIAEDPATGSGAGLFATYLARHRVTPFGQEIEIDQGLRIGRPSRLRAVAYGDEDRVERVEVAGCAVLVGRGELTL